MGTQLFFKPLHNIAFLGKPRTKENITVAVATLYFIASPLVCIQDRMMRDGISNAQHQPDVPLNSWQHSDPAKSRQTNLCFTVKDYNGRGLSN
eukprot:1536905-Amphidinium_carterae.1